VLFDYLTKGEGTFPQGIGSLRLVKGESTPRYSGEDLASSFYYMAAQLLARHRVKFCEGCSRNGARRSEPTASWRC
jgi:hypothetical protein